MVDLSKIREKIDTDFEFLNSLIESFRNYQNDFKLTEIKDFLQDSIVPLSRLVYDGIVNEEIQNYVFNYYEDLYNNTEYPILINLFLSFGIPDIHTTILYTARRRTINNGELLFENIGDIILKHYKDNFPEYYQISLRNNNYNFAMILAEHISFRNINNNYARYHTIMSTIMQYDIERREHNKNNLIVIINILWKNLNTDERIRLNNFLIQEEPQLSKLLINLLN